MMKRLEIEVFLRLVILYEARYSDDSGSNSDDESDDDYNNGHVSDDSEDPRPAKRRRRSPNDTDTASKRSRNNSGGGSDDNASELEKDMLIAVEEQEKSSSFSPPSSAGPSRRFVELSRRRIDQVYNQSRTSHGVLEGLEYSSSLGGQDQEEEPQEQQQQQEAGVEAMRDEDHSTVHLRPTRQQMLSSLSTESLSAKQLEIGKYHLRLCGIRARQIAGRKTKTIPVPSRMG
jgi:hypothetical protein